MAIGCGAFAAGTAGHISLAGFILLAIISLGFIGAGLFVTDPAFIGDGGKTRSGKLHVLFAFLIIFLFPIMATVVDLDLAKNVVWEMLHPWLLLLSAFVWSGLIVFIVVSGLRVNSAKAPVGYAERYFVLTISLWLLIVALPLIT
jgi:hypothetical protein